MKLKRKIIKIDEDKCDGCGICANACHEGAIKIIGGKAKLVRESHCDGLGACIGHCPLDAITIEEREADAFDEAPDPLPCGCPGTAMRSLKPPAPDTSQRSCCNEQPSSLGHWPVQLKLVPVHAPFLKNADLLVCADCVPFAVADFHPRYLEGRSVLVGCPKLDDLGFYKEKLKQVFAAANPSRITVLRMEVPCCGGIAHAAIEARNLVTPGIPLEVHMIGVDGTIIEEKMI
ncbi:MAG: hypothetical protein A2583_05110 [Bdellovibrionales bacterium RIFOXYD1_FULL_53_11]|nr:MAG: hypothetical protein A2583_05110 [Bdellovibrionales bacterium RIFOXYD1_FULL_53_11]